MCTVCFAVMWIRIRKDLHPFAKPDPDPEPHQSENPDPDPHQGKSWFKIQIRIKVKGRIWIQIRIKSEKRVPDPYQTDPHQCYAEPQQCFFVTFLNDQI
jgi:hypothetical protein